MKIGITNDHSAVELKNDISVYLQSKGHEIINYGANTKEAFDYPLAAKALCDGLKNKECELGIAICGTGVGISIAANKHNGIRACCCSDSASARLSRLHNNANVICFGARIVAKELAYDIVDAFINNDFSNEERHNRRIDQIGQIEKEN